MESMSRSVETADRDPEPEFIPTATDRPVGLDLDEFLPVSHQYRKVVSSVVTYLLSI